MSNSKASFNSQVAVRLAHSNEYQYTKLADAVSQLEINLRHQLTILLHNHFIYRLSLNNFQTSIKLIRSNAK